MFLLGNYESSGPALTQDKNSGNMKSIVKDDKIAAVFCMSRRGNLVLQADEGEVCDELVELIIKESLSENIQVKGVIGPWKISSTVWALLKKEITANGSSFESKEVLYRLPKLDKTVHPTSYDVRYLQKGDFPQWKPMRLSYEKDTGLSTTQSGEKLKDMFDGLTEKKLLWGIFDGSKLIGTAALNSIAMDIGQVGGVFTSPEYRQKGVGTQVMKTLHADSAADHKLSKMILFTGENNIGAQKLYESLGYLKTGYFGLFLS